ncbi:MAG TPA: hypothetical protein VF179_20555 [Thermoanaerobaculia bacterium]|nr:hypothetical protein [Thermoanaerobaculia bacterium]
MTGHRVALFLALAVTLTGPAEAQDLEVFELETFVDPSVLTLPGEDGQEPLHLTFLAAYLRTGISHDFQYRSEYLSSRVGLVDLIGTVVRRRLQFTGRWTGYGYDRPDSGTAGRAEAQLGYYFISPSPEGPSPSPHITRLQVSVARATTSRSLGGTTFGIDLDTSVMAPYDVVGGLSYAYYRPDRYCDPECTDENTQGTHFASMDVRTETWEHGKKFGFDMGMGTGLSYQGDQIRWNTLRLEFRFKKRLYQDRWSIYGVYAPAYRLDGAVPGTRVNHEASLFLHLRAWSTLLPRLNPPSE